ncbi:MAG: hypothetical protein JSR46_08075, partial [Verrucomicrobia bacterium]|nr:hypothetical protein [Verrucomicrobiota bacterium]
QLVATLIKNISAESGRSECLVSIFKKMIFSPLGCCSAQAYKEQYIRTKELLPLFVEHLDLYPRRTVYKIALFVAARGLNPHLAPDERLALFNKVLKNQISAQHPFALQIMCDIMAKECASGLVFADNDELKQQALEKIIDAVFAMPYARAHIIPSRELPDDEKKDISLLQYLLDCVISEQGQAAAKGYPIVQKLTANFIALLSVQENPALIDECVYLLLALWSRSARYHLFESEEQFVETLKLCISTPLLHKILQAPSWHPALVKYSLLLNFRLPDSPETHSDERKELFLQFIQTLLSVQNDTLTELAKALFAAGMAKDLYTI